MVAGLHPGKPLGNVHTMHLLECQGIRVGLIGLAEEDWVATLATVNPQDVEYTDFVAEGTRLATTLRVPGSLHCPDKGCSPCLRCASDARILMQALPLTPKCACEYSNPKQHWSQVSQFQLTPVDLQSPSICMASATEEDISDLI